MKTAILSARCAQRPFPIRLAIATLCLPLTIGLGACAPSQAADPAPAAEASKAPATTPDALIRIAPADYAASRLRIATAAPAAIEETLDVYGEITVPRDRERDLTARYPGVVRSVQVQLGDTVKAGDTLLTIESNDSLRVYPLTSPISGRVLDLQVGTGEAVRDQILVTIADLSQVNASLTVFSDDVARLRVGQPLHVRTTNEAAAVDSQLTYIGARADDTQRGISVRAPLDNAERRWIPGQFIRARITVAHHDVAVAVPTEAVQSIDAVPHVFVETPDGLVATPVRTGTADADHTEILDGIRPGTRVADGNTFMLKSELLTREEE